MYHSLFLNIISPIVLPNVVLVSAASPMPCARWCRAQVDLERGRLISLSPHLTAGTIPHSVYDLTSLANQCHSCVGRMPSSMSWVRKRSPPSLVTTRCFTYVQRWHHPAMTQTVGRLKPALLRLASIERSGRHPNALRTLSTLVRSRGGRSG